MVSSWEKEKNKTGPSASTKNFPPEIIITLESTECFNSAVLVESAHIPEFIYSIRSCLNFIALFYCACKGPSKDLQSKLQIQRIIDVSVERRKTICVRRKRGKGGKGTGYRSYISLGTSERLKHTYFLPSPEKRTRT